MKVTPTIVVVTGAVIVPVAAACAVLIYICHTIATGAAVVLEIILRSL